MLSLATSRPRGNCSATQAWRRRLRLMQGSAAGAPRDITSVSWKKPWLRGCPGVVDVTREKHSMRATTKLYLCYSEWPRADKALWQKAFKPKVDLFDGGGPGAHLSERSVQQLQYAY